MKISRKKLDKFIRGHSTGARVLDVGASSLNYRDLFPNKVSIDLSKKSKPDIVGDAHNLPFEENEFAMVLCTEMLEHVVDPEKVVSELRRVLKSGGKLVLTTRFLYPIHEAPNDYWRFTRYNLERIFSNWSSCEIYEEADPMTSLASLLQRFGWQSKFRFNYFWKIVFVTAVRFTLLFSWIVRKQYGDIGKTQEINNAFPTGYYVVAYK